MREFFIKNKKFVSALEKNIPVYTQGNGKIPLLVLGQASLFRMNHFIHPGFNDYCTTYFIDIFEEQELSRKEYTDLTLDDFLHTVDTIRVQLGFDKIALFSHSAVGVLAIEYAKKYFKHILFNIVVASSPIWGQYKQDIAEDFFKKNSSESRKNHFFKDQDTLQKLKTIPSFVDKYMSRRSYFFKNIFDTNLSDMWKDIRQDETLIGAFFRIINEFDIRDSPNQNILTFLALGLEDRSNPFYTWTDDVAKNTLDFLSLDEFIQTNTHSKSNLIYYIFDAAHFPFVEDPECFFAKTLAFMRKACPDLMPENTTHNHYTPGIRSRL